MRKAQLNSAIVEPYINKIRDNSETVRASDLRLWTNPEVIEIYFRYRPEVDATMPTSGLEVRTISDLMSNIYHIY